MEVKTVDDVLKMFNIDRSKIVIDEEYLKTAGEPFPFKIRNANRKVLIAGTYKGKWVDVIDCETFFIFGYDGIDRSKRVDKKTGDITDYKVVVA